MSMMMIGFRKEGKRKEREEGEEGGWHDGKSSATK
jgi:hypothetical protein